MSSSIIAPAVRALVLIVSFAATAAATAQTPTEGWAEVVARIECVLPVAQATQLSAARAWDSGPVALEGRHDVVLTAPDGAVRSLFDGDPATATASRILTPGDWRVAIDVYVTLSDQNLMQYSGAVLVDWGASVAAESGTWGMVKARYR